MTKVVSLESLKDQKAAKRGFREWQRRFRSMPILDEHSLWADLPDELLLFLAEDDEGGRQIIHDLLMGGLGLGSGYEFESLSSEKLLPLLDIYFLLIDQVRFECMRRLGWVHDIPLGLTPIIRLIREYKNDRSPVLSTPPMLAPNHPAFLEFSLLSKIEQQSFIRRMIPEAVKQFQARVAVDGNK
jgi:hypothetical protein